VIDVGGRRPARGAFTAPVGQTKKWIVVNIAPSEQPDVVGDAARLPMRAGTADWVLCLEVLQYVERPESVVAEIARVLAPGGRAVLAAPFLHRADGPTDRHRFTAVRLIELVGQAGLAIAHIAPQGAFFTTVANFLRQAAAHIRRPAARYPIGSLVMPLGWLLRRADRLPGVSGSAFLGSFTTGFVVVARKP
jgi:SAM-dependent methyltransferase